MKQKSVYTKQKHFPQRYLSKGLSILEILIAIAIVSFVFIPAIQILYSIQPQTILRIIGRGMDDNTRSTFHENGNLKISYHLGGAWNSTSLSHTNFSQHSCIDFDPTYTIKNSKPPHMFTYTREELGISTSTVLTGTTLVGQSLYISANSSSTTEPDLFIYDIPIDVFSYSQDEYIQGGSQLLSKPVLTFIQSKNLGPGVSSVQSRGSHIISANTGVKNQADISDAQLIDQIPFTIPGSNSDTSPLTKVIVYASSTLIIGTEKSVLAEIVAFDIYSGQVLYTIETGYGINDMVVSGNNLIVAGPRDPEIEVFDISTQILNRKVGQYDLPGGSGNAKVLALFGDTLYVARTKGGNEFVLLNIDTKNSSTSVSFNEVLSNKIGWSIDSMLGFEQYVLLLTADEYKELQLYDLSEDSTVIDRRRESTGSQFNLKMSLDLPSRVNSSMCFKTTVWLTFQTGSDIPLALITF